MTDVKAASADSTVTTVVQIAVEQCWEKPEALGDNTDRVIERYRSVSRSSDLVVFPELTLTGYIPLKGYDQRRKRILADVARRCVDESIPRLLDASRDQRASLVVGFMEPTMMRNEFHNSIALIEDGRLLATYRKIHLPVEENHYFTPGSDVVTADSRLGRIGLSICYDIMFPEMGRLSALQGAEILVYPSNWLDIANLRRAGEFLPIARALEAQAHVVFVNGVGELSVRGHQWELFGRSRIVAATGSNLATAGPGEEILTVELTRKELDTGSDVFPLLRDRRPDVYAAISRPLAGFVGAPGAMESGRPER